MKGLKGGPELPPWALWVVIAIGVVVLAVVGFRALTAGGPRDPRTFPKEAYQPPGYGKRGENPYGQRPAGPGTSAGAGPYSGQLSGGNPYSGAYGRGPAGQGQPGSSPYSGAYGSRPGGR